jgi:hypothetical protein
MGRELAPAQRTEMQRQQAELEATQREAKALQEKAELTRQTFKPKPKAKAPIGKK